MGYHGGAGQLVFHYPNGRLVPIETLLEKGILIEWLTSDSN